VSVGLRKKQAKSNLNRWNSEYRGIPIDLEIESQRYSSGQELDYGSQMDVGSDQSRVDNENNNQSQYSNMSNIVQGGVYI